MIAGGASGAELSIQTEPYFESGLFYRPLISEEGTEVTFTVRADVEGQLAGPPAASFRLFAPDGTAVVSEMLSLAVGGGTAEAEVHWQAETNGLYRAEVRLDPGREIAQENRDDDEASLDVPVVVKGRRLFFPWFAERSFLRWANVWAGGIKRENVERWRERGVLSLAHKHGDSLPIQENDPEAWYKEYVDAEGCPGIAINEWGYYPQPRRIARYEAGMAGLAKARKEKPDQFVLLWHPGAPYPEQLGLYHLSVDLAVLESYVFYFGPRDLKTEQIYDTLDMKMQPVRQLDAFAPTYDSPATIITSVDIVRPQFDRGEIEQVVRHLRRKWPEMRGFGIFDGLMTGGEKTPADYADEKFIDQLCYEYFVAPVVTFLPQSVWVSREDDGAYLTAAVSNIGGIDSGEVRVTFTDNGRRVGEDSVLSVPAGNSRLTNRAFVKVPWRPKPGAHVIEARIEEAGGTKVLDSSVTTDYFWQRP